MFVYRVAASNPSTTLSIIRCCCCFSRDPIGLNFNLNLKPALRMSASLWSFHLKWNPSHAWSANRSPPFWLIFEYLLDQSICCPSLLYFVFYIVQIGSVIEESLRQKF